LQHQRCQECEQLLPPRHWWPPSSRPGACALPPQTPANATSPVGAAECSHGRQPVVTGTRTRSSPRRGRQNITGPLKERLLQYIGGIATIPERVHMPARVQPDLQARRNRESELVRMGLRHFARGFCRPLRGLDGIRQFSPRADARGYILSPCGLEEPPFYQPRVQTRGYILPPCGLEEPPFYQPRVQTRGYILPPFGLEEPPFYQPRVQTRGYILPPCGLEEPPFYQPRVQTRGYILSPCGLEGPPFYQPRVQTRGYILSPCGLNTYTDSSVGKDAKRADQRHRGG